MKKKTFKTGGIHIDEHKVASAEIDLLPLPMKATVALSQHIGPAAKAVVAKGDRVVRGQLIGEAPGRVSACVHAPISGLVTYTGKVTMANGKAGEAIVIEAGEEDHASDTEAREEYLKRIGASSDTADFTLCEELGSAEIRRRVAGAGIVGLGGAAFPSHVKLDVPADKKAEVLIINACECEPYLMCDDALMRTYPGLIVEGTALMMKASGTARAVIAVEDNKPEAASRLKAALGNRDDIRVEILATKYPQGGEKQVVEAVTGRRIGSGALPLSEGVIVHNVGTAFAVRAAVAESMPLIERVVTVSGDIDSGERRNYLAAIGTPLGSLPFTVAENARGVRFITGGPMMGQTAVCLDAPVCKGTSGLTVLADASRGEAMACVRCGSCVDACPMGLEPYLLARYGALRMWEDARSAGASDCLECGACSYSCPSNRPLTDYIRLAKRRKI